MKKLKNIYRKFRVYLKLPHIWVCLIILLLAVISLLFSHFLNRIKEIYWSSVLANLFAGFLTGFIIYLIGSIKQIYILKIQEKQNWLSHLSQMILEYIEYHHKLFRLHFDKFDGNTETFETIYETGVRANWVNEEILQSSFNEMLSFDTVEYCKNNFSYDAVALTTQYQLLHDQVELIDIECPNSKTILKYFEKLDYNLMRLNSDIRKEINALNIQLSQIQKSII